MPSCWDMMGCTIDMACIAMLLQHLLQMYVRKHCHYRENAHAFAVLWCRVEIMLFSMCLAVRISFPCRHISSVLKPGDSENTLFETKATWQGFWLVRFPGKWTYFQRVFASRLQQYCHTLRAQLQAQRCEGAPGAPGRAGARSAAGAAGAVRGAAPAAARG